MDVLECLARLRPGAPSFEFSPAATGARLSSADIAMALGEVNPPGARALLRYLYCEDDAARGELIEAAFEHLRSHHAWAREKDDAARRLVCLRVGDLRQGRRCPVCRGRGSALRGARLVDCSHCNATGKTRITEVAHAKAFGVARSGWYAIWLPRYKQVCGLFDEWHAQGERLLRRNLFSL